MLNTFGVGRIRAKMRWCHFCTENTGLFFCNVYRHFLSYVTKCWHVHYLNKFTTGCRSFGFHPSISTESHPITCLLNKNIECYCLCAKNSNKKAEISRNILMVACNYSTIRGTICLHVDKVMQFRM